MPSLVRPRDRFGKELEILLDWHNIAAVAAGTGVQSNPISTPIQPGGPNGSLAPNERAEILAVEIWSPFSQGLVPQDLRSLYLILDSGADSRGWFYLSGRADLNTTPPWNYNGQGHQLVFLGGGYLEAAAILGAGPQMGEDYADLMARALVAAAVPHFSNSCVVAATAGATAVTAPWHVRLWGHRWLSDQVNAVFDGMVLGGRARIKRPIQGKSIEFDTPQVPITADTWNQGPGGNLQAGTRVWPLRRWAINAQPTTAGQEYDFTYTGANTSAVAQGDSYQNMDFAFDQKNNIVLIDGFGIKPLSVSADGAATDLTTAASNLAYQWITVNSDALHRKHPVSTIPASDVDNPYWFGLAYPFAGLRAPTTYLPLQTFGQQGLAVFRDRVAVACQDNGTSVPANQIGACLSGILIENFQNAIVTG